MDSTKLAASLGCGWLLALISLNWATTTMAGIEEPLYSRDFLAFGFSLFLALSAQLVAVVLIGLITQSHTLLAGLFAIFGTANLWSTYLILSESYADLSSPLKISLLIAVAALLYLLSACTLRTKAYQQLLMLALSAMVILNVGSFVLANWSAPVSNEGAENRAPLSPSANVTNVRFVRTPNLYLIGLESAAPRRILEKYLGLRNAPLTLQADKQGFRIFPNVFSEGSYTRASWHTLLGFDADYAREVWRASGSRVFFSGLKPSPLFEIFKSNGYEITSLYKNSYLGTTKGPYVDHYVTTQAFSPCDKGFLPVKVKKYLFWGGCYFRKLLSSDGEPTLDAFGQMREIVISAASRSKPQLIVHHAGAAMHTPTTGWTDSKENLQKFGADYLRASLAAVTGLDAIFDAIRIYDPSGIVLIFGDHGITLSRGRKLEENPTYVVQDRFAVMAGIYPRDSCKDTFDASSTLKYYTTRTLVRLIVKCLAGGADPIANHTDRSDPVYDREGLTQVDFGQFLYQ